MHRIAIATFRRAEYASALALMRAAARRPNLDPLLLVGGSHCDQRQGHSIDFIRAEGLPIADVLPFLADGPDCGETSIATLAAATVAIGKSLAKLRPDVMIVSGDRFELLGAAGAALMLGVPVAHVSGGEITEGALDEQVRHAVTKLSSLHFVAMEAFRQRLLAMGEAPERVMVTGDPALDLVTSTPRADREELSRTLGIRTEGPLLMVALHSATRGPAASRQECESMLAALDTFEGSLVFSGANIDPGGEAINELLAAYATRHANAVFRPHLGQRLFHGLLACADGLVGNSSSGIWEAPSFQLPVLNIGERQKGRTRGPNVIDATGERSSITEALHRILDPGFRRTLAGTQNPYGDGMAADRIMESLSAYPSGEALLRKPFHDISGSQL